MAENEVGAVIQEPTEFLYPTKVEDIGPATKKITIEIPPERIAAKLSEQFKELRAKAAIPGFRPGHAPQKLVEKRFNTDVREDVRRALVSESYQQALEKNALTIIGEPEFDNPDGVKLPESGPLNYSFQVEIQPQFTIPPLVGLRVRKPKVQVTEEHIDHAMKNLRDQQGTLVPVEDRGVQAQDVLTADVQVKCEGQIIADQRDAQLVARPARIAGIEVPDLDKQLEGAKPTETRTITAKAPETHAKEEVRGKDVQIDISVKDIKQLEPAELTGDFLNDLGFKNEQELRAALHEQMLERVTADIQQVMRDQIHKYLMDSIQIELPAKLSAHQEKRVINRRAIELTLRGVPREQVQANLEQLKVGAAAEAAHILKLFFILDKLATEQGIDVTEGELNGAVAMIAVQQGHRPEKVKQEMAADGSLAELYRQMRERKAVDAILLTAQIEEVDLSQPQAPPPQGPVPAQPETPAEAPAPVKAETSAEAPAEVKAETPAEAKTEEKKE